MAIPYKLARTRNGKIRVKYRCPKCQSALESEITEAGDPDQCPDCGEQFTVPAKSKRDQLEQQLRQQQAEAKREAEEAAKRAEADRLAQEAQRRQAEQVAVATLEQSDDVPVFELDPLPLPDAPLPQQNWPEDPDLLEDPETPAEPASQQQKRPQFNEPRYPTLNAYRRFLKAMGHTLLILIPVIWLMLLIGAANTDDRTTFGMMLVLPPFFLGVTLGPMGMAALVGSELLTLAIDARVDLARIVYWQASHNGGTDG